MIIFINHIRDTGLELNATFEVEIIGAREDDGFRFLDPLEIKANINKADNTILVDMKIKGRYASLCARCLCNVREDWEDQFLLNFKVDKNTKFINIREDIRQEVLLDLPTFVLCHEDCKGICLDCGVNLNKEECENKTVKSGEGEKDKSQAVL